MKNKIFLLAGLLIIFFTGCFKDEGNYTYKSLNPPTWLMDVNKQNIDVYCRAGGNAKFVASDKFVWVSDSIKRASEVRYEWRYNGILLSEKMDFEIPTLELMELMKITTLSDQGYSGTFCIVEKETGISFMAKSYIKITPQYSDWDWFVISEDGENTKCSAILRKQEVVNGSPKTVFELEDNSFGIANKGMVIPGKPVSLHLAKARNISSLGSATVLTDKVAFEINTGTMQLFRELEDDFLDGVPANLRIIDRDDIDGAADFGEGSNSFIASKDGLVYTRQMSANYLGGKFLTEPYIIDSKGYKITEFAHHTYGHPNVLCYDELNRRVIAANRWRVDLPSPDGDIGGGTSVYKCRLLPVKPVNVTQKTLPVWNMPEGTKVLHLTQAYHLPDVVRGTSTLYTMYYNDAMGKTMMADFVVSNNDLSVPNDFFASKRWCAFPGGDMDEETIFLTSAASSSYCYKANFRTLYTKGNQVRYIQRQTFYMDISMTDNAFLTLDSKVTFLAYDWYDCTYLMVGCENGDICLYDIYTIQEPQLLKKMNVKGKVVSIKQVGPLSSNKDYY